MFAQSVAWPDPIAVARDLARTGRVRMATLNNESEELNRHRIELFGLHDVFPTFFTSCWLRTRKPSRQIYEQVLGMTQADPARTLFIDDRLQNLAPAASLGMQTLQFTSAGEVADGGERTRPHLGIPGGCREIAANVKGTAARYLVDDDRSRSIAALMKATSARSRELGVRTDSFATVVVPISRQVSGFDARFNRLARTS